MRVFQQAAAGLNLTPGQRAFLKLVEGCLMAAFVTVLPLVAQLLGGSNPDYASIGRLALAAFGTAFLLAMAKYYKAQGDAPLGALLDTAAADLRQFGGIPNDVKIEPDVLQVASSDNGTGGVPPVAPPEAA